LEKGTYVCLPAQPGEPEIRIDFALRGASGRIIADRHMKRCFALVMVLVTVVALQALAYAPAQEYFYQTETGNSSTKVAVDRLVSTRLLLNPAGGVMDAFAYDAWGTLIASNGLPQTVYLYTGEQFDPHLGFYYLRARYLNTGTGRFWTRDSWEGNQSDPLSLHKYMYCHADPVNLIDPSGFLVSAPEATLATATATKISGTAIFVVLAVYAGYVVYETAESAYAQNEYKKTAKQLGVDVEPALSLNALRWGGHDPCASQRKRDPGWVYFAHGTSTGAWKGSSILPSGSGDFGTGFYTFKADVAGLLWAAERATKTAKSGESRGFPFILVVRIKEAELENMVMAALDLRGNAVEWTAVVKRFLTNNGQGATGRPIVIGPVSVQGRALKPRETPTERRDIPGQWKWEDVSKLEPAGLIPVFR